MYRLDDNYYLTLRYQMTHFSNTVLKLLISFSIISHRIWYNLPIYIQFTLGQTFLAINPYSVQNPILSRALGAVMPNWQYPIGEFF